MEFSIYQAYYYALEFARWLSPAFAIWCNQKIKELLTTGQATVQDLSEEELYQLAMSKLSKKIEMQKERIRELEPNAQYAKEVLQSKSEHTITSIAKELDITSGRKLNMLLKDKGIIYKQDGHYVLKAQYQGLGYTKTRTHKYVNDKGQIKTALSTVYTERGRKFIHRII